MSQAGWSSGPTLEARQHLYSNGIGEQKACWRQVQARGLEVYQTGLEHSLELRGCEQGLQFQGLQGGALTGAQLQPETLMTGRDGVEQLVAGAGGTPSLDGSEIGVDGTQVPMPLAVNERMRR